MSTPAPGGSTLAWRAWWLTHLARRHPFRLTLVCLLATGAASATAVLLTPFVGTALLVVLALTLDEVFLPIDYHLDEDGVRARTWIRTRRHAWGEFTDVTTTGHGVLLRSPVRRSRHLLAIGHETEVTAFALARVHAGRRVPGDAVG